MFVVAGQDWTVRSLDDDSYPVFVVWEKSGKLLGVAGSRDALQDLLADAAKDHASGKLDCKSFQILGVQQTKNKVQAQGLVALLVKDKDPEAECRYKVVVRKADKNRRNAGKA